MKPVPVMTFHSVGDHPLPGDLRHLTTSPEVLDGCLRWLTRQGFHAVTQQELFDHLADGSELPARSIGLSFDDGYLDNWVHVHPALQRHGLRGVIYVTGDFIDPGDTLHATAADGGPREALPGLGYCNRAELAAMARAGTLEVQSHLMTHSWLPVSGKIVDFHRPGSPCVWAAWNASPAEKPFWLSWKEDDWNRILPWGAPVYASARSHVRPGCTPDPTVAEALTARVADEGAARFFAREDWRAQLTACARDAGAVERDGALHAPILDEEGREAFEARFEDECRDAQRAIEGITGQPCNFMAWPGGEWDARLQELALRHYDATFTTEFGVTVRGEDPRLLKRAFFAQRSPELTGLHWPSVGHFAGRVRRLRGQAWGRLQTGFTVRLMKLLARRRAARP